MRKFILAFGVLSAHFLFGQADYEFVPSNKHFVKAYEHLAQEEFSAAFDYFDRINSSDTLYELGQLNKWIAEYTGKYYKDVINTCEKAIERESKFESEAHYYKIKSLIDLREFEKAKASITIAKKRFPLYFQYEFLVALMLEDQGKYEEAKAKLQAILMQHPQHSPSHYQLAKIMAEEGREIIAILGFQMAIISNRNSTVLKKAFGDMENMMQNNFEVSREEDDNKLFSNVNNLITSKLALNRDYKAALSLNYSANNVTDLMFNQFSYKEGTSDFTMNYYGKFFQEVKKKGLEKGYTLYLLAVIQDLSIQKLVNTYEYQVNAFEELLVDYWYDHVNENKFEVNGKVYQRDYILDGRGMLSAVGKLNDKDEKVGPWIYFYSSGKVAAKTNYNDEGKLQGENFWYDEDGVLKESGVYEDGKLNGFGFFARKDGTPSYDGEFQDNELNGEVKIYDNKGIISQIKVFKNNEANGPFQKFYTNGQKASEVNLIDGERDGEFVVLSPEGDTIRKRIYSRGKAIGDYVEHHSNGKIAVEGQFKGGDKSGDWKSYFYDGAVAYIYSYKNDKLHGDYIEFDANGDTMVFCQYANGNLHGVYKDYGFENKVLWEHYYKNGKFKKYNNYNDKGEIISKGKKNYQLNDRFGFKYIVGSKKGNNYHGPYTLYWKNGQVKEQYTYEKGILQGEGKEFFDWGGISVESYYLNGELHGLYKSYYDNGTLYAEGHYQNGEQVGEWKYYHPNGELSEIQWRSNGEIIGNLQDFAIDGKKRANYFYKGSVQYKTEVIDTTGEVVCKIKTPAGKGAYNFLSVTGNKFLVSNLDGGEHHGKKEFYYPNGKLIQSFTQNHGEDHGPFVSYYPDGKTMGKGVYSYGKKDGEWKHFYHNGKMSSNAVYDKGIVIDSLTRYFIDGGIKEVEYYDKNGTLTGTKYFHPSGVVNSNAPEHHGFTHGTFENHDAFGEVVISRTFNGGECISYGYEKDGKLIEPIQINGNGLIKTYYNNGQLGSEYAMKNGLYEGPYKRLHSNGKPWVEANYLHDKIDGNYKAYYENGQVRFDANYHFGRLNGKLKKYSKKGVLLLEESYVEGVMHGDAKYYDQNGKLLYTLTYNDDVVIAMK